MALALDGPGGHSTSTIAGTGPFTVTITTTSATDVLELFVEANGSVATAVSSVTDNSGVTAAWQKRAGDSPGQFPEECWWTTSTGVLTGTTITVTMTANTTFITLDAIAVSGANTASPFDGHSGIPVTGHPDPLLITTNGNAFIVAAYRTGSSNPTAGSGWTLISGADFQAVEYQITTASSLSATLTTGSGTANGGIVDAIVAPGAGSAPVPSFGGFNDPIVLNIRSVAY